MLPPLLCTSAAWDPRCCVPLQHGTPAAVYLCSMVPPPRYTALRTMLGAMLYTAYQYFAGLQYATPAAAWEAAAARLGSRGAAVHMHADAHAHAQTCACTCHVG